MTGQRRPLMAGLADHRRDLRILAREVAARVGVDKATLSRWERGVCSPRWSHVLAYAAVVDRRVVVWQGGVLAPGADVPQCLAPLREAAGLSQDELARRMRAPRHVARDAERDRGHILATVEAYVTALGAELRHLPLEAP